MEVSVLSGSITSMWPAPFGLFACLDFGPCPLFPFLFLSWVLSFYYIVWQGFIYSLLGLFLLPLSLCERDYGVVFIWSHIFGMFIREGEKRLRNHVVVFILRNVLQLFVCLFVIVTRTLSSRFGNFM